MTINPQKILQAAITAIILSVMVACGSSGNTQSDVEVQDSTEVSVSFPDTLRVGTLYSPASYFIYRETTMGYDYDLVNRLAEDKKIAVDWVIANNLGQAVALLDSGKIDLLAYEVPITAEYLDHVVPCGVENITHQVLVQPRSDTVRITDVTMLIGRDVYVEKDSKYYARMLNLNNELGGGINIKTVERDTLITEDLIAMVSDGEIPLTVVDSDIARINKTYYPKLDITLNVSFPQRSAWGVAPNKKWLADSINKWADGESPRQQRAKLLKRYYELSKRQGGTSIYILDFKNGRMSPFDHLFKRHAQGTEWDWRLLASVAYAETRYDSTLVSWAGARGIMQLMPATARAFGLTDENITNNDANIGAAVKIFKSLNKTFASKVKNPQERIKFILAAYNSGPAHILDAISIAKKTDKTPDVWDGNVAEALLLKSNPEFYNDPTVCKYGYFRGRQTYEYVRVVTACYEKAKKQIP